MKVQVYFTMDHENVLEYKQLCREFEMNFSEYIREAVMAYGPPTLEIAAYLRAKKWGKFSGTLKQWSERVIPYEFKGQHKHLDGRWCGIQDCPQEKMPLDAV